MHDVLRSTLISSLFVVLAAQSGCGEVAPAADAGGDANGGTTDAAAPSYDAPRPDASRPDAALPDAGLPDAGIAACAHDECTAGAPLVAMCSACVSHVCAADAFCCDQMWDSACQRQAEQACGMDCPPFCGDLTCDADESSTTCEIDCPAVCGDEMCNGTEDCFTCPGDCGDCVCGDTTCNLGECSTCEADCPNGCNCHDVCEEGDLLDPSCSDCAAQICQVDPFCCQNNWDAACVGQVETVCGQSCPMPQ